MKRILLGLVVGCTFSSVSYAQSADQLFQEGMKLADAGNYEAACPKFAASQKLDPAFGTLFNLADCHEKTGQSKVALEEFRQAVAMAHGAGQKDRELKAMRRAEALEPKVNPEPAPVSVEAKPTEKAAPELTVVPLKAPSSGVAPSEPSALPPQRIAALGVAGIGLASIVLGTVSGLNASSKWKSAQDGHCNVKDQCDSVGRGFVDDAKSAATVSNVGFIAGSSLLAASAVLWFTATKSPVAPLVGTTNGLLVQGTF